MREALRAIGDMPGWVLWAAGVLLTAGGQGWLRKRGRI